MRRVNATVTRLSMSPEELAVIVADAKVQRRVSNTSTALDELFENWIIAATEHFREQTGRELITAALELWLDCPPTCDRYIELPRPPLQAVQAFEYLDGDGEWATFDAENYTVLAPRGTHCAPGRLVLNSGASWPTPVQQERAVRISFTAGYGDAHTDIPRLARTALMFLVGHFHKYGEEVVGGLEANSLRTIPLGAAAIIQAFKWSALPTQRPWEVSWLD